MRRYLRCIALIVFVCLTLAPTHIVQSQGGSGYLWPDPLNEGQMPTNEALLPPANAMPTLPLETPLIENTLFFNAEAFGEEYRILNLTLDERLYAYNITTQRGALPVSPTGQYAITTVNASVPGPVTCGILDIVTNNPVDEFLTDGACSGVEWSPDSTKLLHTVLAADGTQALSIRQNGQETTFRPIPTVESDLGGGAVSHDRIYIINRWVSDTVFSIDLGLQGNLSEELFVSINNLEAAFPAINLTPEMTDDTIVLWRPSQPLGEVSRGMWMSNVETGDAFKLAPSGYTALIGDVSPNGRSVVYWAATESDVGPVHPLRLVVYYPETNELTVLLQFDGPSDILQTRPGLVIWNPDGIYFHLSQQQEGGNGLQTGTYRIQPDGTDLEFVTPHLLMDTIE